MKIETLSVTEPSWVDFVSTQDGATIFHHPAWAGLLAECYGYRPFVLAALDDAGRITGGIPFMDVRSALTGRRWISLPFSDYCAPLCADPAVLEALVEDLAARRRAGTAPRIEIRWRVPEKPGVHLASGFVLHTVTLMADPEALLKTFDKTRVRETLRQAVRRGVEIRRATDKTDMFVFYDMLVETRRRHGAPVQPRRYFDLYWDRIVAAGLGFLLLAYKDHEPIGGTVYGHYQGMLTAKYNASAPKHWKLRANNSLYWEAIKWGCENGFAHFDFGRTEIENQNLREFKNGWGAVEEPLWYATIGGAPRAGGGGLDRIVKFVIRRSPPAVCRLVGEALYRHYA